MVKQTLNKIFTSRAFFVIFSILAAVCLWVYIAYSENPDITEYYSGIPIEFVDTDSLQDKNLIVTASDVSQVSLRLSGKRIDMTKLKKDNISIVVDVSRVTVSGTHQLDYDIDYGDGVAADDIVVSSASVNYITVTVEPLTHKTIPVTGDFNGNIAENYIGAELEVTPATIKISGPKNVIDRITYAYVVMEREEISATTTDTLPYKLMDANDVEVVSDLVTSDTDSIVVTQKVSRVKEVPLTVNLAEGAGANSSNTTVTIEPSSITIIGDAEIVDEINTISLGTIDLSSFTSNYTREMPIILPDGVSIQSGVTSATVNISIVGLDTIQVTSSNFQITNETDGYSADLLTESLNVTIRGSASRLNGITAQNVRIVVSLEGIGNSEGMFTIEPRIYIDGVSGVGAVGDYEVNVRVSKS